MSAERLSCEGAADHSSALRTHPTPDHVFNGAFPIIPSFSTIIVGGPPRRIGPYLKNKIEGMKNEEKLRKGAPEVAVPVLGASLFMLLPVLYDKHLDNVARCDEVSGAPRGM